jgi:hypothetical protein
MKRFWLVLLSLGLIVAFSTSAMAVDVKFAGEYYAAGVYLDKTSMTKSINDGNPSTAFYFQRLRVGTEFVVSPGLKLITRADIMERAWGTIRTVPGGAFDTMSAGTRAENENIAFDLAYVSWVSPFGLFNVGYQIDQVWGTQFGDTSAPTAKIVYAIPIGNFTASLQMGKFTDSPFGVGERSAGMVGGVANAADRDNNFYTAAVRYAWKTGDAGMLLRYQRLAVNKDALGTGDGFLSTVYLLSPYAKAKLGPVALQAQVYYAFGNVQKWDGPNVAALQAAGLIQDVKLENLSGWLDATADFGMFYLGLTGAYVSGEDQGTTDKWEGGVLSGGLDWNPCLIMFNQERTYWIGGLGGYAGTNNASAMTNAWFGQFRAGVRPVEKLDIALYASYAKADKSLGVGFDNRSYGTEVDLTATYKITNNLSYMLGGGYWFAGDYYKGNTVGNNELNDNFMLINKLTLTF